MSDDEAGEWLPVQEAAARLGTTEAGIRSRINRQTLRHRKGNDGKVLVLVPDEAAIRLLQERDEAREQAELWRSQAEAAKLDAASARAERDAAKAVAVAETNAAKAAAAAEVAAKDALIGELKALLVEARKPWWRKLTGR